jgi:hypothetical protein
MVVGVSFKTKRAWPRRAQSTEGGKGKQDKTNKKTFKKKRGICFVVVS